MKEEVVGEWMSTEVISILPETTLPEAHRIMTENRIRRLPVVQDGQLVGIVTLGDVREAEPSNATTLSIWELNYILSRLCISEIMTPDPLTISIQASVREAAHVMLTNKVSGLPVVDEAGRVVGIITESDIFRMVARDWSR